jgi:ankyrin repeat protein
MDSMPEFKVQFEESYGGPPDASLHDAAAKGDFTEMSRLIDAGYDINARDEDESNPLHCAIGTNNLAVVRLLLSHGADTTLRDLGGSDGVRDNASMLAARINAIAVMQELIAAGDRIYSHALALLLWVNTWP